METGPPTRSTTKTQSLGDELVEGLTEAVEHSKGQKTGAVTRVVSASTAAPDHMALIMQDAEQLDTELKEQEAKPVSNAQLIEYAEEYRTLKDQKDQLEADLKGVNDRIKQLREVHIPQMMQKLGMVKGTRGSFTFQGGKIHLETKLFASVPEPNRHGFFGWLRENGEGDLIKEQVNAQTLSAWIRSRREDQLADPPGVSIHELTSAKLTK